MTSTYLPRLSIVLISASALAYEILLMRLFSIIQWHHFAYMIISLALLGYGASGTFLSLAQRPLLARFPSVFIVNIVLFAISAVMCFLLTQQLPLNPEEVLWDQWQPLYLFTAYLLLAIPFFFASNCVALAIVAHKHHIGRIYSMDMVGAGLGSLGAVALLFFAFPNNALLIVGATAMLAAAVGWWELRLRPRSAFWGFTAGAVLLITLPSSWMPLNMSPFKNLPQALHISGTKVIAEHSSPLGLLSVVESSHVPWRHAPGLSLNATVEPPQQLGVFSDGEAMTAITRYEGGREQLAYLDNMTSALPYHLNTLNHVLVLGSGGGAEVLQARYHDAADIDAVELNSQMAMLIKEEYDAFINHLFTRQGVKLHINEARGYVMNTDNEYDLIQVALLDAFSTSAAGLHALNESYLYTVEALQDYLKRLRPEGYLALTRWIKLPPRDTLKLLATAIDALRASGVNHPEQRLILIRGWQTSTLIIKNGVISDEEIRAMKRFCTSNAFDTAYYPGIKKEETNRFNILSQPYFYDAALALLGDQRAQYLQAYKFSLEPATDNRPYFFHFFKWEALTEILALRGQGGAALLEWGYLVLIATLVQAVLTSVVLILLPLLFSKRIVKNTLSQIRRFPVFLYFGAIGLAFLFIEMAFIQKFILFLHHPLYAAAVVLTAFLLFAGLGSAYSQHAAQRTGHHTLLTRSVIGIIALGSFYLFTLPLIFSLLIAWPVWLKIIITVTLIAPLAFCMGMPFPLAMTQLGKHAPALIPWAWAVNGCASVISVVLATLLAVEFGFATVIGLALCLYGTIILLFPQPRRSN